MSTATSAATTTAAFPWGAAPRASNKTAAHPLLRPKRLVLIAVLCVIVLPVPCGCGPEHPNEAGIAGREAPLVMDAADVR